MPKEWTPDQIRSFQDYFDALLSGNLGRRRMMKFVPSEFKLIEARQPPLKDQYDEWLARLICYAFSVPASAFITQVNRATSATLRLQATQEGLIPLKGWIKGLLDTVVQEHLGENDLEFAWVGDDAVDPLQQAQTLNILVTAGIKTREEARAELGLTGPPPKVEGTPQSTTIGKYNSNHDDAGLFSTAENAVSPGGRKKPQSTQKPKGVQVASNSGTNSDAAQSLVGVSTPKVGAGEGPAPLEYGQGKDEDYDAYYARLMNLIAERPPSRDAIPGYVDRYAQLRQSILDDPQVNAWRQNLDPTAFLDPSGHGGENPIDPFKDSGQEPTGQKRFDEWIPSAPGIFDRMASDGLAYSFPVSALTGPGNLSMLGAIDDRYRQITGEEPTWSDPLPTTIGQAFPAWEPKDFGSLYGAMGRSQSTEGSGSLTSAGITVSTFSTDPSWRTENAIAASEIDDMIANVPSGADRLTPPGDSANNKQIGEAFDWGTKEVGVQSAMDSLSTSKIENLMDTGITRDTVAAWRDFYVSQSAAGRGGEVARLRAIYMRLILGHWPKAD